jgi:hypothetical protein
MAVNIGKPPSQTKTMIAILKVEAPKGEKVKRKEER